jgi:hypothetical protein
LRRVQELAAKLQQFTQEVQSSPLPNKEILLSLAQDLPAIWNSPTTDMRLKQRIVRILIHEIIADVDESAHEVVFLLHSTGGRHSELRIKKNMTGKHRRCTSVEAVEAIRQMAGKYSDRQIASTLNRLGLRTGAQHAWTEGRVRWARQYHGFPPCDENRSVDQMLTMEEAAKSLGISARTALNDQAEEAAGIAGRRLCPLADSSGSVEDRRGPEGGQRYQKPSAAPAGSSSGTATTNVFSDVAR